VTAGLTLLLVEDDAARQLRPLSWTRPVFELRWGLFNLRERAEMVAPGRVRAVVRPHLRALMEWSLPELAEDLPEGRCLALNGRAALSVGQLQDLLERPWPGARVLRPQGGGEREWIAAWLEPEAAARLVRGVEGVLEESSSESSSLKLFARPWELVAANGEALCVDARQARGRRLPPRRIFGVRLEEDAPARPWLQDASLGDASRAAVFPGVYLLEEENILFGSSARIKPGVVLDAQEGPIVLGAGCRIESNVTIVGPAYVGPGSVIHPMTRLREGSSIGALCKVGGEVEESIVLDLSNKQHDGFLGHAYVGSWVNLGADTNASDLKNNYSTIRVDQGDGPVDTGLRLVGPTLGDHVRTGINTMLTTGTVAGVCANIFGAGFPPRWIPDFSWGGDPRVAYRLDRALETAQRVHRRRKVCWEALHEDLLRAVHAAVTDDK